MMLTSYTWRGAVLRAGLLLALLGLVAGAALAINPIRARRMGGAPAFNPANYGAGSLRAWFKADSLNLADGASVATWADSSPSGNDATAGTSPVFKVGIQNGKPGVLFASASLQFLNATGVATGGAFNGTNVPFTYIAVARQVTFASTHVFVSHGTAAGGATMVNALRTTATAYQFGRGDAAAFATIDSAGAPDGGTYILSAVFDGTNGTVGRNGAQLIAPAVLTKAGAQTFDRFTLGCRVSNGTAGLFLDGYLFEVLIYASALSDADRQAIERALGRKWGIAVN